MLLFDMLFQANVDMVTRNSLDYQHTLNHPIFQL